MTANDRIRLNQTIYQHNWEMVDEWVAALDEMAELTDAEIDEICNVTDPNEGN